MASGVFPPGLDHYPLADISSTIALQFIGSLDSASTRSAAAIWLSFSVAIVDVVAALVAALGLAFTLGVLFVVFVFFVVAIRSLPFRVLVRWPGDNRPARDTSYLGFGRTSSRLKLSSFYSIRQDERKLNTLAIPRGLFGGVPDRLCGQACERVLG